MQFTLRFEFMYKYWNQVHIKHEKTGKDHQKTGNV